MHKIKQKRTHKREKTKIHKNHKCMIFKKCDYVPCGHSMNRCTPSYCLPGQSRNWQHCNMANWNKLNHKYQKYRHFCKDENKCIMSRSRKKTKDTVDAITLHNKMPYIWRFLKPNTRKHMIELANKEVKDINIPFSVFPDPYRNHSKKQLVNNMIKHKSRKVKKLFYKLRKKYKNI